MRWLEYYGDIDEYGVDTAGVASDKLCDLPWHTAAGVPAHVERVRSHGHGYRGLYLNEHRRQGAKERNLRRSLAEVAFTEPLKSSKIPHTAPDVHLNLEWVHGFNSKQARQTVAYTGKGHIVYPAGALGVVYNIELKEQLYMNAHTDTILCLRAHVFPDKQTRCASGEAGKLPKVLVWTTGGPEAGKGPEVVACPKGFYKDGVSHVA